MADNAPAVDGEGNARGGNRVHGAGAGRRPTRRRRSTNGNYGNGDQHWQQYEEDRFYEPNNRGRDQWHHFPRPNLQNQEQVAVAGRNNEGNINHQRQNPQQLNQRNFFNVRQRGQGRLHPYHDHPPNQNAMYYRRGNGGTQNRAAFNQPQQEQRGNENHNEKREQQNDFPGHVELGPDMQLDQKLDRNQGNVHNRNGRGERQGRGGNRRGGRHFHQEHGRGQGRQGNHFQGMFPENNVDRLYLQNNNEIPPDNDIRPLMGLEQTKFENLSLDDNNGQRERSNSNASNSTTSGEKSFSSNLSENKTEQWRMKEKSGSQRSDKLDGKNSQFNRSQKEDKRRGPNCSQGSSTSRLKKTASAFNEDDLTKFLDYDSYDVIDNLFEQLESWTQLFGGGPPNSDRIISLIIRILGEKVCLAKSDGELPTSLLLPALDMSDMSFCKEVHRALKKTPKPSTSQLQEGLGVKDYESELNVGFEGKSPQLAFFSSLYNFLHFVVSTLPSSSLEFTKYLLPVFLNATKSSEFLDLHGKLKELKEVLSHSQDESDSHTNEKKVVAGAPESKSKKNVEDMSNHSKHHNRYTFTDKELQILDRTEPKEDFRSIPIIPTIDDLLCPEENFLRPNKTNGAYLSVDHYLDVQFRLLREDFVRPLKQGIQEFLKHKNEYLSKKKRMPFGTVRLYQGIRITDAQLFRDSVTYSLQLPEETKRIKWDRSRRLMNGSLLIFFVSDNLNANSKAYFGTVCRRDVTELTSKGVIGIAWEGDKPDFSQKNDEFLMFESECYFEAYRHTLQVLKDIPLSRFPMFKFLVESSTDVGPPKYLKESAQLMIIGGKYASPTGRNWPTAEDLELDDTQYEAFRGSLTKEFAIVQGPPGTGKTFLGLKVVEALLTNLHVWWEENKGPILIVCLTNHALDQFLLGILKLMQQLHPDQDPGLIRVGGRSKVEALEEFNLINRRKVAARLYLHDRHHRNMKSEALRQVRSIESERNDLMSELVGFGNLEGVVNFSKLRVWNKLYENFEEDVWEYLKNPEWYHPVSEIVYADKYCSVDAILNMNFQIRAKPKTKIAKPKPRENNISDDEDYDIEEIQASRIIEDVYYQVESNKKLSSNLVYVSNLSIESLQEEITKITRDMDTSRNVEHLRRLKCIAENKKRFLEKFFEAYKEGLIEFVKDRDMRSRVHPSQRSPSFRWSMYFDVVEKAKALTVQEMGRIESKLIEAQKELQRIQRIGDGELLRNTKVVGMTTTGASKAGDLLEIMKSKIVIVEEAAEVLEPHILNCLTEHCEHLIQIGDHQQLRPNITVLELASRYNLNISLFERMVMNKLHCFKLMVQHRMRPEISDLVRDSIYKDLSDHHSVRTFPPVTGMEKSIFFITHHHFEKSESDSVTKMNDHEAKFLVALARYLILQGYQKQKITILSTYTGQMFLIKKLIRDEKNCQGIHVTAVDNFQGEENDIILLSLVRSNKDNNIGFLKIDNRICVALSRARHGLYIIGNMDNLLSSGSSTWRIIHNKLRERNEFGDALSLVCQTHGTVTKMKTAADFSRVPEGGCTLPCGKNLPCGHPCKAICHVDTNNHKGRNCFSPCAKQCLNGHPCMEKCSKPCKPCMVVITKTLPCNHCQDMACWIPETSIICEVKMDKVLPCGHHEELKCCKAVETVTCRVQVDRVLQCTHKATMECHVSPRLFKCESKVSKFHRSCGHEVKDVPCHFDISDQNCQKVITKLLICQHTKEGVPCHVPANQILCETLITKSFSNCQHVISIKCRDQNLHYKCELPCPVRLKCGHQCRLICHPTQDPNHYGYKCMRECVKSCKRGHLCKTSHKCYEPCPLCQVPVTKLLACKTHKTEALCSEIVKKDCLESCDRKLTCTHKCENLCFQSCGPCRVKVVKQSICGHPQDVECNQNASKSRCNVLVKNYTYAACGHFTQVPCRFYYKGVSEDISKKYCTKHCGVELAETDGGCGHICQGNCSECVEGRLHAKCNENCGRSLICGHICDFPCSSTCPPCTKECGLRCDHSRCGAKCGEPCIDCCEPCTWRCPHLRCTMLCRDLCNREPCNEPCNLKLRCGHSCVGLCGEPCPPHCRICNREELTEFQLYGNEEDDDARFVYLEDCRHSIEVEGMDFYMNNEIEVGAIVSKKCPRCKTLIRRSRRYGNILRRTLKDVIRVKTQVYGNQILIMEKQVKLIRDIDSLEERWKMYLPDLHKYLINRLTTIVETRRGLFGMIKDLKRVEIPIDQHSFGSVELIAKHGKDAIEVLRESESRSKGVIMTLPLQNNLLEHYKELFGRLTLRKLPLSTKEVIDFDREFQRLFDLKQLFLRKSSSNFGIAQSSQIYGTAYEKIMSSSVYTQTVKAAILVCLKELDDCLRTGLGISDRERRDILSAMSMKQGAWFKCPNGHIYVIDRCGGAMQEGTCNECGARIGGGDHQLRQDNSLASEMDGARAPAWPSAMQYH